MNIRNGTIPNYYIHISLEKPYLLLNLLNIFSLKYRLSIGNVIYLGR